MQPHDSRISDKLLADADIALGWCLTAGSLSLTLSVMKLEPSLD